MPPNDSPFDDSKPAAAAPEAPAPEAASQPTGDVSSAVAQALEPFARQIAQQGQHLEQLAQVVAQQVQGQQQETAPAKESGGDKAFLDRFVEDPETVLQERVTAAIKDVMTPYMGVVLADQQHDALGSEKQAFEKTYGDGAWEKMVEPRLKIVLENMAEPHRASREHIRRAVAGIKGSPELEDELFTMRQERAKKMAEAERNMPAQFVGAGRPAPRRDNEEISSEGRDFLQRLGRTLGPEKTLDEATIKKLRSLPKTPEAYRRFHEEQRKANGAG